MSLRDFNTPYSDDPIALHHTPGGNETGLESFHTIQPEDIEPNNTPKIVGAIAVALMVSAAGVALYASQGHHAKQVVAAAAPVASAPVAPAPAAAPSSDALTPAPDAVAPAKSAAAESVAPKAAPVKTARRAPSSDAVSARMAAAPDVTPATEQTAAIPTPVSPTPSPSDVATNNTQSGVAVPQGATSAADIPNPAPAQDANPTPAPVPAPAQASAEPSGQVAQ